MLFTLTCDTEGRILELVSDSLLSDSTFQPGTLWTEAVHPACRETAEQFLQNMIGGQSKSAHLSFSTLENIPCDILGIRSRNLVHIAAYCPDSSLPENPPSLQNENLSPSIIQNPDHTSGNQQGHTPGQPSGPLRFRPYPCSISNQDASLLERAFHQTPDTILISDLINGAILYLNHPLNSNSNSLAELQTGIHSLLDMDIHPQDRGTVEEFLQNLHTMVYGDIREIEFRVHDDHDEWHWYLRRDSILSTAQDGTPYEVLTTYQDIHPKRLAQQDLFRMSTRDPLTDLYNRVYFNQEIERLQGSRQYPISILMADVDGLKHINDALGHSAGDYLIRRTADVLRSAFRNEDVVARIGGDEFGVILSRTSHEDLQHILKRVYLILDSFNEDLSQIEILLSIGYATAHSGDCLLQTLREADLQMYGNKTERKSNGYIKN